MQMAYGARSIASFGLIGEKSGTGGASSYAVSHRGEFYSLGKITGGDEGGAITASYTYGNKKYIYRAKCYKYIKCCFK